MARLRGGALVPVERGSIKASWPSGVLEIDDVEVRVDIRPRWLASFLGLRVGPVVSAPSAAGFLWSCRWVDLDHVVAGPCSVVFYSRNGRGCRFVGRERELRDVVAAIETRGIPIENVRSTIGRAFNI